MMDRIQENKEIFKDLGAIEKALTFQAWEETIPVT